MYSNKDLRIQLFPLIIEQILASLMGTVDTMMVSRISEASISGVSLVDSINKLVIFLFTALATGGAIICSQYLGHKDSENSKKAAGQVILAATALSLLVMLIVLPTYKGILKIVFGTVEEAVMHSAEEYFYITIFSYPFLSLFGAASAVFRAAGNTKLPMKISVSCNLLNIAGNALLIFVLKMGVKGAALSTLICTVLSAVLLMFALTRSKECINPGKLYKLRFDFKLIWTVLCVGIPTGVENAMFQLGKVIVQSTVSMLGTAAIAANAVVAQLEFFTSMPSKAIGTGLMTVSGTCIGAGNVNEARYYIKKLTKWSFWVMVIVNWGIFFLTKPVIFLAGLQGEAAKITFEVMLVISIIKPMLWPAAFVPNSGTAAAGDVKFNMIISTVSMWVLRVGGTTLLCRYFNMGLIGIWCGYFFDWAFRGVIFLIRFKGEKWHSHNLIN